MSNVHHKRKYAAPSVRRLGSLTDLTKGDVGSFTDGGMGNNMTNKTFAPNIP